MDEKNYLTQFEKDLLYQLYRFRFVTIGILVSLCHLSSHVYIRKCLHRLIFLGLVTPVALGNTFMKPVAQIYTLAPKSIAILLRNPKYHQIMLRRIYHNQTVKEPFIFQCLYIADLAAKWGIRFGQDTKTYQFLTQVELAPMSYIPHPTPHGYVRIGTIQEKNIRYFLHMDCAPSIVSIPYILKRYHTFSEENIWQEKTKSSFPTLLFLCESEKRKEKVISLLHDFEYLFDLYSVQVITVTEAKAFLPFQHTDLDNLVSNAKAM